MIYLVVLTILITEAAKVREHLWASKDHTHWAKRPYIKGLPASDPMHISSGLSHFPIIALALYLVGAAWWIWVITGLLSQLLWWQAKSSDGRDWPNKLEQLHNWIKSWHRKS